MALINVAGLMLSDRTVAGFEALFGEGTKNVFCGDFARLSICPFFCHLLDPVPGTLCSCIQSQTEASLLISEHRVSNE